MFVDVLGAFDALIRELLFSDTVLDEHVAAAPKACGFGPEVMHELARHVASESVA